MMRLILAVFVGLLVTVFGTVGTEFAMLKFLARGGGGVAIIPDGQVIALQLTLSTIVGLLGAWMTVAIAKGREWGAGAGLAGARLLMLAASLPSVRGKQPEWFLVTLLFIGIATAFALPWIVTAWRKRRTAAARTAESSTLSAA